MSIKIKNIFIFAGLLVFLFCFYNSQIFEQVQALPVPGKTCQQGATEKGYDIGCTVSSCASSSKPCCYGCGGDSGCKPCDYCGPVEPGGFATCCLVKCCKGPFSDSGGEWCSGTCPSDPTKECNLDLTITPHTCGCSSKCTLDAAGKNCVGGCDLSIYTCGFDETGFNCECRRPCASYKPDPSKGDACDFTVCPVKGSQCVDNGAGGCKCLSCEGSLVSSTDNVYSCTGLCPDTNKSCNINLTTDPPTCGCSSQCKFDTSTGKCTGGCVDGNTVCHLDDSDKKCFCGSNCPDSDPNDIFGCSASVCPTKDSICNFDSTTNKCACSSPCQLNKTTEKCSGGCDVGDVCGFLSGSSSDCGCGPSCSGFKPDYSKGQDCDWANCPEKDFYCIPNGVDGCVCVKPAPCALASYPDGKYECVGSCPDSKDTCNIDVSTKPPTCSCSGKCRTVSLVGTICKGGCAASSQVCGQKNDGYCECTRPCTDYKSTDCYRGVCSLDDQDCVPDGTGCTCATPNPSPTSTSVPTPTLTPNPSPTSTSCADPANRGLARCTTNTDTTTLQAAPTQKCSKTKPPTCGGECDDLNKVCVSKFSKKKNKMICKCKHQDAVDDDSDEEESEE